MQLYPTTKSFGDSATFTSVALNGETVRTARNQAATRLLWADPESRCLFVLFSIS